MVFKHVCLRVLLRIKPAFYGRISNKSVVQQAGQIALELLLVEAGVVTIDQETEVYDGAPRRGWLARRGRRR